MSNMEICCKDSQFIQLMRSLGPVAADPDYCESKIFGEVLRIHMRICLLTCFSSTESMDSRRLVLGQCKLKCTDYV